MTDSVLRTWLELQCQRIAGARTALVMLEDATGAVSVAAASGRASKPLDEQVRETVESREIASAVSGERARVSIPFECADRLAVLAVEIVAVQSAASEVKDLEARLRDALPIATVLLGEALRRERDRIASALLARSLGAASLREACTALATELASVLRCERVTIGLRRGESMEVVGLSHSADFDARSKLIQDLVEAMNEAADQDATVVHPRDPAAPIRVALAHEALCEAHDSVAAATVPLSHDGRVIGALTIESRAGGLSRSAVELAEAAGAAVSPALELHRLHEESWISRRRNQLRSLVDALRSDERPHVRVAAIATVLALGLLLFATSEYKVAAEATLEGRVQRAIVAGLDGFVSEANARAGDLVSEGEVLGALDARDLGLETRRWTGRYEQLLKEHRQALAQHDRSRVNILAAEMDQAEAELALLQEKLARTKFVAPFDGVVVQGDLSRALGSPVERGDVVFEIAPLDGYRIILEVDERDIADVADGQQGELALSSLPDRRFHFTVKRITPISVAEEGRNFFRVEAALEESAPELRPGMEGVAKIHVEHRNVVWIATHRLFDWLRLRTWSWF